MSFYSGVVIVSILYKRNKPKYEHNINAFLSKLESLSGALKGPAQYEILKILANALSFSELPSITQLSRQMLSRLLPQYLLNQNEKEVIDALHSLQAPISKLTANIFPQIAMRFQAACDLILSKYARNRVDVVNALLPTNKISWLETWVKAHSSGLPDEEKRILQNHILGFSNSNDFPRSVYSIIAEIKVGRDKSAVADRQNHFTVLMDRRKLSVAADLQFVLERMDVAGYRPTDEQKKKLISEGKDRIPWDLAPAGLQELITKILGTNS